MDSLASPERRVCPEFPASRDVLEHPASMDNPACPDSPE